MWLSSEQRNVQSIIGLIASDASYQTINIPSTEGPAEGSVISLPSWHLVELIEDSAVGFGVHIYAQLASAADGPLRREPPREAL